MNSAHILCDPIQSIDCLILLKYFARVFSNRTTICIEGNSLNNKNKEKIKLVINLLSSLVNGGLVVSSFTVVLERSIFIAARVISWTDDDDFKSINFLLSFDFAATIVVDSGVAVAAAAAVVAVADPHCSVDLTSIFACNVEF